MRTAQEMIHAALLQTHNIPEFCQGNTVILYGSHPVGDVDHDGDADAVDGWESEPRSARHTDRRPDIGAPGSWGGGSAGHGHRAPCIGYDHNGEPLFRSTDAGGVGVMATRPLSWFDRNWPALHWLGWSTTISGDPIQGLQPAPGSHRPVPPAPALDLSNVVTAVKSGKAIPHGLLLKTAVANEVGKGKMNLHTKVLGSGFKTQYRLVQKKFGAKGSGVDGIPGMASLTWLGSRHGFTVHP